MADTLRLEGSGKDIDLYPWLTAKAQGHEALAGILGFGLPGITNQWFAGAQSGSTYRGSRVENRLITLPMMVYAENRADLNARLSELSIALDPFSGTQFERGPARLFFGMPDDDEWYVDVARSGGGDWARKEDSDDRTYFTTKIQLEAGDAFWTRTTPEDFTVERPPAVNTLLPRIAKLRVSSATAFGSKTVSNIGDTFAWPVIKVSGPTDHIELIGPNGEEVEWFGTLTTGEYLLFNMRDNTVEDHTGANRYDGLGTAPRFWAIAPGTSEVQVGADNSTVDTEIYAQWRPRRWAVA